VLIIYCVGIGITIFLFLLKKYGITSSQNKSSMISINSLNGEEDISNEDYMKLTESERNTCNNKINATNTLTNSVVKS